VRYRSLAICIVAFFAAGPVAAQPADIEQRLAESERAIAELRAALEAAEKRRAAEEQERAQETRIAVRSRNGGLLLSGFVHLDVAYSRTSRDDVDANGEPLNETRFNLRRSRIRIDADYKWLFGSFELDANTNRGLQVRPQSFDIGVRYRNPKSNTPYIALHLGLVRAPFGFEVQQSDKERLYLERSTMASAFFPGEYDLGVRLFGAWRWLRYIVAGMNGDPIGERAFPGRDPNQSKDVLGYLGVDFRFRRVRLAAGLSGLYGHGFHKAVTTTLPMSPSSTFAHFAVGGDLQLAIDLPRIGALTLLGEATYATNLDRGILPADPVAAGHDLRELGYYLGFTQELTRWAIVGVRWDQYVPDLDAGFDRAISTVVVATGARLPGYARLTLQYLHTMNGAAATATTNDVVTLRGEILF
jgi:hypothetical protein